MEKLAVLCWKAKYGRHVDRLCNYTTDYHLQPIDKRTDFLQIFSSYLSQLIG